MPVLADSGFLSRHRRIKEEEGGRGRPLLFFPRCFGEGEKKKELAAPCKVGKREKRA